jgi:predicted nucleic acid-binding protein
VKVWLLDTGPLVAYLDPRERDHTRVAASLEAFRGRLVTSGAVITEAMHFLAGSTNGPGLLASFVAASSLEVYDVCQPKDLADAAALMGKYADTPMDFADATLLLLAEHVPIGDIATLDRRGFSAYRTRNGKSLRLVLG